VPDNRKLLVTILQERLIPFLQDKGFGRLSFRETDRSPEIDFCFPFGYMRRVRNSNFELIEVQLDKRGSAKFVINCGVVPPSGARLPWKHYEQDEALISALSEWYRLHSSRVRARWFSPPWFALSHDLTSRTGRAVNRAVALYPEIETWFASGVVGPHMRRVGFPLKLQRSKK
jgi:hypothetical protein